MSMFSAISTAGTGLTVYRKWLDAISDNITNVNTVRGTDEEAFRARYVIAQSVGNPGEPDAGVQVGGIALGDGTGRLVYEPQHPLADADGNVRYPDIDMASQMTQMIMAQRGYQANLAVVDRARDAYMAALQIGRS
jgi:flagellar basal-body rod protein FlgC